MTKHRVDIGGAVVADSSGRPGYDGSVRGKPPRPEAIEADPGGRGLGLSADRAEDAEGPRSARREPGPDGRCVSPGGREDAAVGDPEPRRSPLARPDAVGRKGGGR